MFGAKNGWERPNWFAKSKDESGYGYSFGRQNWFSAQAREHRACRENVAVFDQTGFSKIIIKGPDALNILQWLCGAEIDVPMGKAVYTGMFNARGCFESDLTIIRTGPQEFYIVTGSSQTWRDMDWIRRNMRPTDRAELVDVTEAFSVISVMGPNARKLLQKITEANLSNDAFPFGTSQLISIGQFTARAVRLTYVGELGWELHTPASQAHSLYNEIMGAGKDLSVTNAGHYAINSLRLEKAYRAWGADISPDDTALEAGLGFAINWKKDFLGKEALLKQKQSGATRKLVTFVLQDPEPVLWGSEPILRDGKAVGYTTSGSYAHTLGAGIGMGYVKGDVAGRFEINVSGKLYPATPQLRAPYDPERKRILTSD
jgi:4-methylaminobutanoate oxidase (formaldehyde-forming)